MVEVGTKIYLYALVFLSLFILVLYSVSHWVFHRKAPPRRLILRELLQLFIGAIFLPLYLYGVVGVWTALTASWVLLMAGYYFLGHFRKARPSSINEHE